MEDTLGVYSMLLKWPWLKQKEQDMVMQLDVAYASLKEREEFKGTKLEEEEEDQDVVCEIIIIEFVEQTGRKE